VENLSGDAGTSIAPVQSGDCKILCPQVVGAAVSCPGYVQNNPTSLVNNIMSKYIMAKLQNEQRSDILTNGPISVEAKCSNGLVTLEATLFHPKGDMLVVGYLANGPVNTTVFQGESWSETMWGTSLGNYPFVGAIWTSTGHYLGLDGGSVIGVEDTDGTMLHLAGLGVDCVVAGVLQYGFPTGERK